MESNLVMHMRFHYYGVFIGATLLLSYPARKLLHKKWVNIRNFCTN